MLFRNDDVSVDTDVEWFKKFCAVFDKYGLCQAHGMILMGYTNTNYESGKLPNGKSIAVPYEGEKDIADMTHAEIVALSKNKFISSNTELVAMLTDRFWDEKVFHGVFHYTYEADLRFVHDLPILRQFFAGCGWPTAIDGVTEKFVCPFNREPEDSAIEAASGGTLKIYGAQGVHFESELHAAVIDPLECYRYHHHRFYPESKFDYYDLDLERLDACFAKSMDMTKITIPGLTVERLTSKLEAGGVQPWFAFNLTGCYTPTKLAFCLLDNIRLKDKKDLKVFEFGTGVGLNLMRLWNLGFRLLAGSDIDTKALKVAHSLSNGALELFEGDALDFSKATQSDIIICLTCLMLIEGVSYESFIAKASETLASDGLLLMDSAPENDTHAEYVTTMDPKEVVAIAARNGFETIFYRNDNVEVLRDTYMFRKL